MKPLLYLSALLINLGYTPAHASQTHIGNYVQTQTIQGQHINTSGKVTYLKFWATWCRYCVEEMPVLENIAQSHNDNLNVLSINIGFNQSQKLVERFLARNNYTVATAFDSSGELTRQFDVLSTPTHILLDEHGNELYRSAMMNDELKQKLQIYLPKEFSYE